MAVIFHLDLDAFFVSVERILDPSLEGKPVIVGGDPKGRGVVSACSYEARKYGLHSAMPMKQAYKLCPHGIYLHGSSGEYSKYSKEVKKILEQYAPLMEQASIDEFYMDFTGCEKIYGDFYNFALHIQKKIKETLKLPASIGIGSNKTIAKIASDFGKPMGITYVKQGTEKDFLAPLPVQTIPGVGKVTLKQLNKKGIHLIKDLQTYTEDQLIAIFGNFGKVLWRKANGKGKESLTVEHERKSISKERTFSEDVVEKEILEKMLFTLTGKVCQKLREKGWKSSTVSIKLRYSDFTTLTRAKTIIPTDDDKEVFTVVDELFRKEFKESIPVRLIGVHLTNFTPAEIQTSLFEEENLKRKKMLDAVSKIRSKHGYGKIDVGKFTRDK